MRESKACAAMPDHSPGLYDDLIARIAVGDREAFGELYRRAGRTSIATPRT